MDITTEIYNLLKERTKDMKKITSEMDELEDRKRNGHLDDRYIRMEIDPKLFDLRVKRTELKDMTTAQIRRMAEDYRNQVQESHRLAGGELNDDAKLFSFPGLLKAEDVEAIMDRNPKNHTMLQMAVRYAEQNNLKINRVYDSGKQKEIMAIKDLEDTSKLYIHNWMDNGASDVMLDQFFQVGDQQ